MAPWESETYVFTDKGSIIRHNDVYPEGTIDVTQPEGSKLPTGVSRVVSDKDLTKVIFYRPIKDVTFRPAEDPINGKAAGAGGNLDYVDLSNPGFVATWHEGEGEKLVVVHHLRDVNDAKNA